MPLCATQFYKILVRHQETLLQIQENFEKEHWEQIKKISDLYQKMSSQIFWQAMVSLIVIPVTLAGAVGANFLDKKIYPRAHGLFKTLSGEHNPAVMLSQMVSQWIESYKKLREGDLAVLNEKSQRNTRENEAAKKALEDFQATLKAMFQAEQGIASA